MQQILTWKDFWQWAREHFTRKFTVWVHVVFGAFCAILFHWYPGLAILLFVTFGLFEKWQCRREEDKGWLDLWDGLFGLSLGAGLLWILNLAGVMS